MSSFGMIHLDGNSNSNTLKNFSHIVDLKGVIGTGDVHQLYQRCFPEMHQTICTYRDMVRGMAVTKSAFLFK